MLLHVLGLSKKIRSLKKIGKIERNEGKNKGRKDENKGGRKEGKEEGRMHAWMEGRKEGRREGDGRRGGGRKLTSLSEMKTAKCVK